MTSPAKLSDRALAREYVQTADNARRAQLRIEADRRNLALPPANYGTSFGRQFNPTGKRTMSL